MKKGYIEEEIFAVLFESEKDKKRRRMLAIMTKTVDAHRLQKMRDLLTFEKLAAWRRINGLIEVWMAKVISFMVVVRSHRRFSSTLLV